MTIRVMIIDDSAFFRRRIAEILNADINIQVIGTAANGAEAVEKVSQYKPDVITMDVEMPVMDGITAVRKIMERYPVPILMFSSLTTHGAKATLDALDAGAMDFMPKHLDDISSDKEEAKRQLCTRIKMLGASKLKKPEARPRLGQHLITATVKSREAPVFHMRPAVTRKQVQFRCVDYKLILIGASTGGPIALQQILTRLPEDFPVPILIIQHMPAAFTQTFAQRLDRVSKIRIKQAEDGDLIHAGRALLAPGGYQMVLDESNGSMCVRTYAATKEQTYKPSVDVTLASAALKITGKILVIMLTGMGTDGRDGTRLLKAKNSTVWAQDEATCLVYGMPMAVVEAGFVDTIIPLSDIGRTLSQGV